MNSKDKAKQDASEQGYPVYMDSKYCEGFLEEHDGNCESCEYSFVCDKILQMTLRYSVNIVRKTIIESDDNIGKINSPECKRHLMISNCEECENNAECYLEAMKLFRKMKGLS